jgi:protein subunit release factor A
MSLVTIDREELKAIHEKLDMLTAFLKQQSAANSLSKYMTEEEVTIATGLKSETLRKYRQYGVFNAKLVTGRKPKYLRKEVNDFLDGKLAHKVWAMREAIKESKLKNA